MTRPDEIPAGPEPTSPDPDRPVDRDLFDRMQHAALSQAIRRARLSRATDRQPSLRRRAMPGLSGLGRRDGQRAPGPDTDPARCPDAMG